MARKFLTDIDLAKNQLKNGVIEVLTSNPSSGVVGQVYYNSTSSRLMVCTAAGTPGTWSPMLTGPVTSADIQDGTIVNADVSASAAIALSKLATDPLARANHTGTQTASTISDFDTRRDQQRLDQHAAPTSAVNLNNQRITSLADPTVGTDAANKNYVDGVVAGFNWKPSVRVATTANITLSGTQTIDGKALAAGDRVLVKNQTAASANGIYVVAAGAWARASDADTWNKLVGASVLVEEGTANGDTAWLCTVDKGGTLGTTTVTWTQFPGAGSLVAGDGLVRTGNVLDVVGGVGITLDPDAVRIDTTVVARKHTSTTITGDGTTTSWVITHNFGIRFVEVAVRDADTLERVEVDDAATANQSVTLTFSQPPASGKGYLVTVIG